MGSRKLRPGEGFSLRVLECPACEAGQTGAAGAAFRPVVPHAPFGETEDRNEKEMTGVPCGRQVHGAMTYVCSLGTRVRPSPKSEAGGCLTFESEVRKGARRDRPFQVTRNRRVPLSQT